MDKLKTSEQWEEILDEWPQLRKFPDKLDAKMLGLHIGKSKKVDYFGALNCTVLDGTLTGFYTSAKETPPENVEQLVEDHRKELERYLKYLGLKYSGLITWKTF